MRSPSRWLAAAVLLVAFSAMPGYAAYRMTAWVPAWDSGALPIMQTQGGNLDEANPGWYGAVADGSVSKNWGAEDPKLRAALTGIALYPTIKNYGADGGFDAALAATIMNSASIREKHAEAITQLVVDNAFDGIDIDYERVPTASRAGFTAFIQLLGEKLHSIGKGLSVTVYAKTGEETRNGPGAQDWAAIGAVADSVKIMAYDYHWSTSSAGALAPLDWLQGIAAYATKTMPAAKVIIGLPWYGYDWMGSRGESVTYSQAVTRAQTNGATIGRDANGEATYSYNGRTVFFQDAESYRIKVEAIVSRYPNIGGFAHWRVGAEDPKTWDIVASLHASGTVGSTPIEQPKKDFAIAGPAQLELTAGTQTAARFSYAGINGFTDNVTVSATMLDHFGGTASLSTPTISAASGTNLTISVPPTTAANVYRILIRMTAGALSHEQLVNLRVIAPAKDFAISGPGDLVLAAGTRSSAQFSVAAINGFADAVSVTATPLDGFSGLVSLSSQSISPASSTTLTIDAPASVTPNVYRILIRMASGSLTREQLLSVRVAAPIVAGSFELRAIDQVSVTSGRTVEIALTLTPRDGFTGSADVTARMLDNFSGTVSMAAGSIAAGGTTSLTVSVPARSARGSYRLLLTATSGSLTNSKIVTVTVGAATKRRAVR